MIAKQELMVDIPIIHQGFIFFRESAIIGKTAVKGDYGEALDSHRRGYNCYRGDSALSAFIPPGAPPCPGSHRAAIAGGHLVLSHRQRPHLIQAGVAANLPLSGAG